MNPNAQEFLPTQSTPNTQKKKGQVVLLPKKPINAWTNPIKSVHVVKLPKQNHDNYVKDQLKYKELANQKPRILPQPVIPAKIASKF